MQITQKQQPHNNVGLELKEILADIEPAPAKILEQHNTLNQLVTLIDDGDIDNNSVLHLTDNIPIISGNGKGIIAQTANSITLVLKDNQGLPATLASYPLDNQQNKPFIHDTSLPSGFILGDMSQDSDWWCVDSIEDGIKLYQAMNASEPVTVIVSINPYTFNDMVKHFAEVKKVNLNCTSDKADTRSKQLTGVNATLWASVLPIAHSIDYQQVPSEILQSSDTKEIDLELLGWGEPEPLGETQNEPAPYPIEAWGDEHSILRNAVEATAYYLDIINPKSRQALAGQCVLGAISTLCQSYVNAPQSIGNSHMPSCLFLLTEELSGNGKSRAKAITDKAITLWQNKKSKEYKELREEWKEEKASIPRKDLEVWQATNPYPRQEVLTIKAGTTQGFLDRFMLHGYYNLSWTTTEGALLIGGHSMTEKNSKANISCFCDIWSSGGFGRALSLRGENSNDGLGATNIRFTLDLQAQPPVVKKALLNDDMNEQGLLPRFLFAFTQGAKAIDYTRYVNVNEDTDDRLIDYWRACNMLLEPHEGNKPFDKEGEPRRLNMPFANREARHTLLKYQTDVDKEFEAGGKYEGYFSYVRRMAENASRVATLMAYFDGERKLSADYIKRACLLVDYSMSERIRYDKKEKSINSGFLLSQWLVNVTKDKTPHAVNKGYVSTHCPNKFRSAKVLNPLLEYLVSVRHIRIVKKGRGETIEVNPSLINAI